MLQRCTIEESAFAGLWRACVEFRCPVDDVGRGEEGRVSQEERDFRLGLTGLTGAEREARVRLLTEQVAQEVAAARAALQARRSEARSTRDPAPETD